MPFEIIRNDITKMTVDAIVNTANPKPAIGSGTDTMIHKKAGPKLLAARQKIGSIDAGCAAITPAFDLQAKYVIHTVARFIKNGISALDALCSYYVQGGDFRHIPTGKLDGMTTEQSYYALTGYFRTIYK